MREILHILGTRPNYVKAAPVIAAFKAMGKGQVVLNTGQHYDKSLSGDIVESLNMSYPDVQLSLPLGLGVCERLAFLIKEISNHIDLIEPSIVILYGDVDSTLAAALVASRKGVPIAHVESGLRSFDNTMPEETNRKVVDVLSSLHFVTEPSALKNLQNEGLNNTSYYVGNSMIDSLISVMDTQPYQNCKYDNSGKILLTCHRPSNVDNVDSLRRIFEMCKCLRKDLVWPMHPRTLDKLNKFDMFGDFENLSNLTIVPPLNYCDFLKMMATSTLIITDSGGIQEETTFLKTPCLTIRRNTERPITITVGSNTLVSFEEVPEYVAAIYKKRYKASEVPQLWDGHSGVRIAKIVDEYLKTTPRMGREDE